MTPYEPVWTVLDPLDRRVSLTRACWHNHILDRRPELEEHVLRLRGVVSNPTAIHRDAKHPTSRQNYYRRGVIPNHRRELVKIVVELDAPDPAGRIEGTVVTVFLVERIPNQEVRLWPHLR